MASDIDKTGPLAWMAKNRVAANLLMIALVGGGLLTVPNIKQEVFPEFDLDIVNVTVAYPGASPAEVEQGVILAIEEAVRGVDGVKEVRSSAKEGTGVVSVELLLGADADRALADVKSAVDRVTSFPADIERPVVSLATRRSEVISLVVYGELDERTLRRLAEESREELLADPHITMVELGAVRPLEVSVEIPQAELRRYNLTLEAVANRIRQASVEIPGGGVKTPGGEVLLRTAERRDRGQQFADVVLLSPRDGTEVRVGDIAEVIDGFRETDESATYNGLPAAMVKVYRVGDQTPIEVSKAVHEYIEKKSPTLPEGTHIVGWADRAEIYRDRVNLLLRNAYLGLTLVLVTLGFFMEVRLAFWVTLGIPISFIGSLLLMPVFGASINMVSLFAFIITLGIVVDDAIVVGEAVYKRREEGYPYLEAAILGVREVAVPVVFAVLTTCMAFAPLLFVPGVMGKFFRFIPMVAIAVLALSLIEALFILPAHLAHGERRNPVGMLALFQRLEQRFSNVIHWLIDKTYVPLIRPALRRRYLTMAICVAVLAAAMGIYKGGRIKSTFMPKIDSDRMVATVTMPFGTSIDVTAKIKNRLVKGAQEVFAEVGGEKKLSRGIFAQLGGTGAGFTTARGSSSSSATHLTQVVVYLVPTDQRPISSREFAARWRKRVGEIAGAEQVTYRFSTGPSSGGDIDIELSHPKLDVLEHAATRLAAAYAAYDGVVEIDDGFAPGKEQIDLRLTAEAKRLGLTESHVARQVRSAFYGVEAVRYQRGREEVRAYVRLPKAERQSEYNIEQFLVRTPSGGELPLAEAAIRVRGRSYTSIQRVDGRRTVNVTADVDPKRANAQEVVSDVVSQVIPGLLADVPGLRHALGGHQKRRTESLTELLRGFLWALVAIFMLLAVAFRSYVQPFIVMAAIPFGFVGALAGHLLMGYDLSLISMQGTVALSGVVVNDSLILIVAINRFVEQGMPVEEAVLAGALRRFRPILLTSLTTFLGLSPMILETSVQARFLIPMAISLGFGVLFATLITLIQVPASYLIVEDARRLFRRFTAEGPAATATTQ